MKNTLFLSLTVFLFASASFAENICDYQKKIDSMSFMTDSNFKNFKADGQKIDQILVSKKFRRVYLLKDQKVIRSYRAAFGDPKGPKRFQGDLKTPEGVYYISRKNPYSSYTQSLEISYPNKSDVAYASSCGRSAGGDVMIHGLPTDPYLKRKFAMQHPLDWTRGCVAVTDVQVREIYDVTDVKTPITICPQ